MARSLPLLLATTLLLPLLACQDYTLAALPGYLGKEFYAVDLNNYDGSATEDSADEAQYSVTVSNPITSSSSATVTITQMGDEGASVQGSIPPGELEVFDLVRWDAEDSFVGDRAFYVESTVPVTAHQFNPANNVGVFSNDASMLVPMHSLGTRYRAACWPFETSFQSTSGLADYLTVVASEGDTTVQIEPTANVLEGPGVPATLAGEPMTFTLGLNEVVQLQSQGGTSNNDLTGSLIQADKPVAVFSGNECALVPADYMACDHIEEQLLPVDAWGERYYVAKFEPRGEEKDIFRIIADEDGTEVTTEPEVPGMPATLAAGEFVEFEIASAFEVTANVPVAVIQYMSGSTYTGNAFNGIGDPAMLVVVPENQFIDEVIFLTPDGYLEDWITIVASPGVEVILDDEPLAEDIWTPFPSGDMQWAWVEMEPGVHQVRSNKPMGLTVYGYDDDVSYAYPGGAYLTPVTQGG